MLGRNTSILEEFWTDLSAEEASMAMGGVAAGDDLDRFGVDGSLLPVAFDGPLGQPCAIPADVCSNGIRLPCEVGGKCLGVPDLLDDGTEVTV